MQDERLRLVGRKSSKSSDDVEMVGARAGIGTGSIRLVRPLQPCATPAARREVAQHRATPRIGVGVARYLRPLLPGPDEGLLDKIVGLFGVTRIEKCSATKRRLDTAEKLLVALDLPLQPQELSSTTGPTQVNAQRRRSAAQCGLPELLLQPLLLQPLYFTRWAFEA